MPAPSAVAPDWNPVTYRVSLTLTARHWQALEARCFQEGLPGRLKIEQVLRDYIHTLPMPEDPPIPPDTGDDPDEVGPVSAE